MKTKIYTLAGLLVGITSLVIYNSTGEEFTKIVIQSGFQAMQVNRGQGVINNFGGTQTVWIQTKNKNNVNYSFEGSNEMAAAILKQLREKTKTSLPDGNLKWSLCENNETTYLRLLPPPPQPLKKQGC